MTAISRQAGRAGQQLTMAGALNRALADELRADHRVLVYGEDVGTLGGVFRVTDGLAAEFGEQRVFDSPLAEAGIVGTAIGMAMHGLRPVVEMQFDAFAYPAFEQITSHLAKLHNRSRGTDHPAGGDPDAVRRRHRRGRAPLRLLRGVLGAHAGPAGGRAGLGLGRLLAAAAGDRLRRPGDLPRAQAPVLGQGGRSPSSRAAEFDRALIRRAGTDVTLIGYGAMVQTLLETADAAATDGVSAEVIDLRTLSPFDDETVAASVRRTGRAVVVHEASGFAGFGAEVVARLTEQCFHQLHAPIGRVTGFDIPYPPPMLEAAPPALGGPDPGRHRPAAVRRHRGAAVTGRFGCLISCCRTSARG